MSRPPVPSYERKIPKHICFPELLISQVQHAVRANGDKYTSSSHYIRKAVEEKLKREA